MPRDRLVVLILLGTVILVCGGLIVVPGLIDEGRSFFEEESGSIPDSFSIVTNWRIFFGEEDPVTESLKQQLIAESRTIPDLEGLHSEKDALDVLLRQELDRFEVEGPESSYQFGNDLLNALERYSIEIIRYRPVPGNMLRLECVLRGDVVSMLSFFKDIETSDTLQRLVYASLKEIETGIMEGEVEIVRFYAP